MASPQPRRRFAPLIILFGSLLMVIGASLFVVPLDNGQQSHTVVQIISDLIASGELNSANPLEYSAPPTPTVPPQTLNEGYCGGTDIWGTCATYDTQSGVMGTGHMQRPIIGAVITQVFGHPEFQSWCGCWKPHTGIDLAAPFGTPIMAADSGQVIWTGWDWSGLGWAVKINHGNYIATIYGHMERFIVKVGQNVTKGQVIGYEGSTGASTGPHLHFMVVINNTWVDPTLYVQLP
ncbi:MAG TPA: M23 family metallopeptidase [Ktedonobacteraceae bacterium]|nr:M23 family metallopeptidase [Ktedonobacteraceae bacterium]